MPRKFILASCFVLAALLASTAGAAPADLWYGGHVPRTSPSVVRSTQGYWAHMHRPRTPDPPYQVPPQPPMQSPEPFRWGYFGARHFCQPPQHHRKFNGEPYLWYMSGR